MYAFYIGLLTGGIQRPKSASQKPEVPEDIALLAKGPEAYNNLPGQLFWVQSGIVKQQIIQSQPTPTPKDFNKNYNGMVPVKGYCFPDLEKSNFCTGEAVPSQPFGYKDKC